MNEVIENAIKSLTEASIIKGTKSHEALQLTQAALNLAHVKQVLRNAA